MRVLIFVLLATPVWAQTPILQAMRDNAWGVATSLAAANPDPLAPRLVEFVRLLHEGQASAAELAAFIAAHPNWPDQPVLEQRYAEALGAEPDQPTAAKLCRSHKPRAAVGLLACAEAYALTGDPAAATQAARDAWVGGVAAPAEEDSFLARWSAAPTQADERTRFEHLETTNQPAARRQLARLDPPFRALAAARLALRSEQPDALSLLAAVPAQFASDTGLLLAQVRYMRRSHATQAALDLWHGALPAAEAAASPARRPAFWAERDALARDLLDAHADSDAYALAQDGLLSPEQAADRDFLAGWIALRRLHDLAASRGWFQQLAGASHAAITQARAFYWLGRATSDAAAARAAFARAATWPFTYYGQLAAPLAGLTDAELHARIAAQRDPAPSAAEQQAFAQSEPARAAAILAGWQDPKRAADFLQLAIQPPASLAARALAAHLAIRLGLPDVAVMAARLAGRDGGVLPQAGWPDPYAPPAGPIPAPLALALIRQESSFDPLVTSAAGAQGLMQLMPATARQMGRALRQPAGPLTDPELNMRLGTAYLGTLLAEFGAVPYAVAAYNAGPHRAQAWMAAHGDASTGVQPDAMVDWIELIPFSETRNYVQRVMENQVVYAMK